MNERYYRKISYSFIGKCGTRNKKIVVNELQFLRHGSKRRRKYESHIVYDNSKYSIHIIELKFRKKVLWFNPILLFGI